CSPSPLAPSYASAATVDIIGAEDLGAASALSGKRRSSKGKGGRSGGSGSGDGGGGGCGGGGGSGGGGSSGSGGGSGGFGGGSGGSSGGDGSGGSGSGGTRGGAVQRGGSGGSQRQQQQRLSETPSPQQLREWFALRGVSGGSVRCPYVIRTGDCAGQTCGRSGVDAFALDYDAILAAMYALSVRAEGDFYRCVPPNPRIEAAALGASESALPGTAPVEALHTFTLDSGASRCFFRDSTTLTPLSAPLPIRLAVPSGGPVLAHSSTVLACPAVLSGSLPGLYLPLFSTSLVSATALEDAMVTTTTPGGQSVSICTCTRTGSHLATFTRRPGSSLYTLATKPPRVAASAQVSASGPVAAPCSCRLLSHQTLLWHHRLGHPSLPRLRGMHSCLLVSGLPKSQRPLPPSPALPCLPCIEGWQRAAPHFSSFPPTTAPLQTLHMDVWGPAHGSGQDRERYLLLVVDNYTHYTTVFPLHSKGEVSDVLILSIRAVRLQLRKWFREDLPVLRLHYDKVGELSSDLLRDFCHGEGILQSFTLPASPQQNGIGERRIGLVMEVDRTSMIHAAAPHFLWPFAVRYAAHQLKLWPRVSLPETLPTVRWMGKVGDALVFWVWGSRAFVRDTFADKLSSCAIPCIFLRFPPDAPGWQFYYPTSSRGLAPSGVSQVDPLPGTAPAEVAVDSGAARGATFGVAASGVRGAEPEGVKPGGAESKGAESGGADSSEVELQELEALPLEALELEVLELLVLEVLELLLMLLVLEVLVLEVLELPRLVVLEALELQNFELEALALEALELEALRLEAMELEAIELEALELKALDLAALELETLALEALELSTLELEALVGESGARGIDAGGAGAGGTGAGGTVVLSPTLHHSQPQLQPDSPLPAPSPYTEQTDSLTERREPESRPASPVCAVRTGRRVPRPCPPPVPSTHVMALRPSSVPLRVPLASPPGSSLANVSDPESELLRAASPTVPCLLATVVTDPSFESAAASALVAGLVDIVVACRLDYAASLVAESESDCPLSVGGECALSTDVLEDRQEDFECLAAAVPPLASLLLAPEGDPDTPNIPTPCSYAEENTCPYSSQWQTAMDAKMASRKSTGTYVDAVPLLGANIVDGIWIFRVNRPPSSPPVFKAPYVARGFTQLQGVFQRFGFRYSSPRSTPLPTGHSLSTPPLDESVELSGLYPELVGCLMYLMTCTRPDLAFPLSIPACYVAPRRHRPEHLEASKRVLRYLFSTSGMGLVLGERGPVVLTGHTDASWLSWLTYLLTDLEERPRSSPVLYVDNNAMIALCQEHIMEHGMKHIALR
ncbi:unnamed protein product, partial [Closterium sp. NIES-54]